MVSEGEAAYYFKDGGQTTVMVHTIDGEIAYVSELGDDEGSMFEVEVAQLDGPV